MFDYVQMGLRIRNKRKNNRMTQVDLAEKSGISTSFLGHIERGSRKASIETVVNLANALQTDANNLLADSLEHNDSFVEYNSASLSQQKLIRKMAVLLLSEKE